MGCQALGEIQIIARSGCECYNSRIILVFENEECLHRATMGMLRRQMGSRVGAVAWEEKAGYGL